MVAFTLRLKKSRLLEMAVFVLYALACVLLQDWLWSVLLGLAMWLPYHHIQKTFEVMRIAVDEQQQVHVWHRALKRYVLVELLPARVVLPGLMYGMARYKKHYMPLCVVVDSCDFKSRQNFARFLLWSKTKGQEA